MSFVLDHLFISGIDEASDSSNLKEKGITHILTINNQPLPTESRKDFAYMFIHALDTENMDLLQSFKEAIKFIEDGRQAGGVLVHCHAGQSRSATVTLAYIMQKMDLSLDDAFTVLMKQRPGVRPNPGFMRQLQLFESMGNDINPKDDEYKQYRLSYLSRQMQTGSVESIPKDLYGDDPLNNSSNADAMLYKCSKCRRPLFREPSVIRHNKGLGEAAFDWRGSQLSSEDSSVEQCTASIFIEPVLWMKDDILAQEGKISCPKCSAKLGSFTWTGERCSCGTWVTPAFHLQLGKVDRSLPPASSRPPVKVIAS